MDSENPPPNSPLSARQLRYRVVAPKHARRTHAAENTPALAPQAASYARATGQLTQIPSYAALETSLLPQLDGLKDFEDAAHRLADAVMHGEAIGISGDYDCDGNCSTALMTRFLQESGVPPERIHVHIPNRRGEGYGVNRDAVAAMDGKGVSLLMTLDNGTLAHAPLNDAKALNMDTVVIDHHPNSADHPLPPGLVVNPKRSDEPLQHHPDGVADLAAVGVTWLLCRKATEILEKRGHYNHRAVPQPRRWLGLVALATQSDVVDISRPLNRALLQEGLEVIRRGEDPYIAALARVARIPDLANLNETDISFTLGPIINAPGRLGQSVAWSFLSPLAGSTELLLESAAQENRELYENLAAQQAQLHAHGGEDDAANDRAIAYRLKQGPLALAEAPSLPPEITGVLPEQYALMMMSYESNDLRKLIEAAVLRQARPMAHAWLDAHPQAKTLTLCGDGWHEGVVGIVAGKLKEEFNLPTLVATRYPDGECKGSARSIKVENHPVDVGQSVRDLTEKEGLMDKAGGHPMAAGCSFHTDQFDAIRARLETMLAPSVAAAHEAQRIPLAGVVDMAAKLPGNATTIGLLQEWASAEQQLRPFGEGTPQPRIGLTNIAVESIDHIGRTRRHARFRFRSALPFSPVIDGHAFHVVGSKLESLLEEARRQPEGKKYMFIGTVSSVPPRDGRGEPELQFRLDDIIAADIAPATTPLQQQQFWANAVGVHPTELAGAVGTSLQVDAPAR